MRVDKVLEYLKDYEPDDELIIVWYDSSSNWNNDEPAAKEVWTKVVEMVEEEEAHLTMELSDAILRACSIVEKKLKEGTSDAIND